MNYTRGEMDTVLAKIVDPTADCGPTHYGDVAIDTVLDAYAATLDRHGLMGTGSSVADRTLERRTGRPIPSGCRSWNLNPTRRLSVHAARRPA